VLVVQARRRTQGPVVVRGSWTTFYNFDSVIKELHPLPLSALVFSEASYKLLNACASCKEVTLGER
jgi:hypothetical protein